MNVTIKDIEKCFGLLGKSENAFKDDSVVVLQMADHLFILRVLLACEQLLDWERFCKARNCHDKKPDDCVKCQWVFNEIKKEINKT